MRSPHRTNGGRGIHAEEEEGGRSRGLPNDVVEECDHDSSAQRVRPGKPSLLSRRGEGIARSQRGTSPLKRCPSRAVFECGVEPSATDRWAAIGVDTRE